MAGAYPPSQQAEPSRLVIAGPSDALSPPLKDSNGKRFLVLPHPRTSTPAYFLPHKDSQKGNEQILELQVVRGERKERSWMLNGSGSQGAPDEKGWVLQDGALHLCTPIDTVFLLLALFEPFSATRPTSYLPLEDLFDSAAARHYSNRIQRYNELVEKTTRTASKGSQTAVEQQVQKLDADGGSWSDIVAFGKLPIVRNALTRCCDVQDISGTQSAYRPSAAKVKALLRDKLVALSTSQTFESHPGTLQRAIAKMTDWNAPEQQILEARVKVASDLVRGYVGVGTEWEALLDDVVAELLQSDK